MIAGRALSGDTPIIIEGRKLTLRFDYSAIEQVQQLLGESWEQEIYSSLSSFKPRRVCEVLAIGLQAHHGNEWTAEQIMALSPPWVTLTQGVTLALKRAYYGDGEVPKPSGDPARPRMGRRWIASWWPSKRRSAAA